MNCTGIAFIIVSMHCTSAAPVAIDTWCHTVAPQIREIRSMSADKKRTLPMEQKRINVALLLKYRRCA